jgi:maltokinase
MPTTELPGGLSGLLGRHLGHQRWFAGRDAPAADDVVVVAARELEPAAGGSARLHWAIVEAGGERYQLFVGQRRSGEAAEFLRGNDRAFVGVVDDGYFYDATIDAELSLQLLGIVTAGAESAERVRPITAEQSNTSLVFDDRIIVKLYRRLAAGANPDVDVTTTLAGVGFAHVAAPVGTWRRDGVDLAFAQAYLAGGTEGWALAQTSLRDFYNAPGDRPADAGGDFSGEANRLGRVTAELHLALRRAWGTDERRLSDGDWGALLDDIEVRVTAAAAEAGPIPARSTLERMRAGHNPGPAQRVHGDYHLGQVMRTDAGWYVLDFEGEPARPVEQRIVPASPLKDVAGMLRSFDYAARFALGERTSTAPDVDARAEAWEGHNRAAFLDGYLAVPGAAGLLGPEADRDVVLAAYELDKALYELAYERAYRPTWAAIPAGAIARILARLG